MEDDAPRDENLIQEAYLRTKDVFTTLFLNESAFNATTPDLLTNSIIGFLSKLAKISPQDQTVIMFPYENIQNKIDINKELLEELAMAKELVEDQDTLSAIDKAIDFLNDQEFL